MRAFLRALRRSAAIGLAAALAAAEGLLAAAQVRGTLYIARYAAEDTELSGVCALYLLPLVLAALAWAVYETVLWKKRGNHPSEK